MTGGVDQVEQPVGESALERRARALLLDSTEALAARATPLRYRMQRWVPAGAMAAAALALLVVFVPHAHRPVTAPGLNTSIEDIDLLTSDVPLTADQDVDFEFYEWAVDAADNGGPAPAGTVQSAAHGT